MNAFPSCFHGWLLLIVLNSERLYFSSLFHYDTPICNYSLFLVTGPYLVPKDPSQRMSLQHPCWRLVLNGRLGLPGFTGEWVKGRKDRAEAPGEPLARTGLERKWGLIAGASWWHPREPPPPRCPAHRLQPGPAPLPALPPESQPFGKPVGRLLPGQMAPEASPFL